MITQNVGNRLMHGENGCDKQALSFQNGSTNKGTDEIEIFRLAGHR